MTLLDRVGGSVSQLEIVRYIPSTSGNGMFPAIDVEAVTRMVLVNLFRHLRFPPSEKNVIED
jgi:hypothetical protein